MSHYGPWTRNEVLDLHILILLIIWMLMDRNQIYLDGVVRFLWRWFWEKIKKWTGWCPQCGWDCDQP